MGFESILFPTGEPQTEIFAQPEFFVDLNLDQVVDAITAEEPDYSLKPFFYASSCNLETVCYRQEIFRDLAAPALFEALKKFAGKMVIVRRYITMVGQLHFRYHREGWFLEACAVYCDAVSELTQQLSRVEIQSQGLLDFQRWLEDYSNSMRFTELARETADLKSDLSAVEYCLWIRGNWVSVRRMAAEIDYGTVVENTFEKFKRGAVKNYLTNFSFNGGMNHIEARILEGVAKLYPEIFAGLDRFYSKHGLFEEPILQKFDREVQFYIACWEYIAPLKQAGLSFCYPEVSRTNKESFASGSFDLALAKKCTSEGVPVVCNDFAFHGVERIFVVSGPNQGGKTTFARMIGQLHFLASLGMPVPGEYAGLFLPDRIFTHYEREEQVGNLRGKLQDDLMRIHDILAQASPDSLIVLNEIFTSTTLQDAVFLSQKVIQKVTSLDSLCVCVTFIAGLSTLNEKTVSMVSTVVPDNPAERTFKILRRPADGLAYALSIAEKYHLTYAELKERIRS